MSPVGSGPEGKRGDGPRVRLLSRDPIRPAAPTRPARPRRPSRGRAKAIHAIPAANPWT